MSNQDDLPIDVEMSRDAEKIVTAVGIRVDCRYCGDWSVGTYKGAMLGYEAHLPYCRGRKP